jgi:hypothetical protein
MEGNNIFLYISYGSFGALIISGILGYINFQKLTATRIWDIFAPSGGEFIPITVIPAFLYIIFSILLLYALISFILIIKNRNEESLREGILGKFSKFHFIPILCAISLYIIGMCFGPNNTSKDAPYIFSLIFSIIGLGSLIFVYIQTSMSDFYVRLFIKKGLYSCLISLFFYNLCYTISFYGLLNTIQKNPLNILNWTKGCNLAFSIIIGIVNLILSFLLKDVVIPGMNVLIYLGLTISFFKIDKDIRSEMNGVAEGVIDIVYLALSAAMIVLLLIKYRTIMFN